MRRRDAIQRSNFALYRGAASKGGGEALEGGGAGSVDAGVGPVDGADDERNGKLPAVDAFTTQ